VIEAICPNGHRLHVPPEHAGMKLRCPACNSIFQLQAAPGPAAGEAPAAGENGGRWSTPEPTAVATTSPASSTPASSTAPASTTPAAATPASAAAPAPTRPAASPSLRPRRDWASLVVGPSYAALVVGLVLVLTAKGCDGLAAKHVARVQGQVDLAQRLFDEEREQAVLDVQLELDDPKTAASRKAPLQKLLQEVQDEFDKRRRELQNGDWRLATNAAARAGAENRAAAYWRELAFVVGTILFALGLLARAAVGQGAERWLAFGLLAIIVFSVYIGGTAWSASILGAAGR
jgi:hypothetical protein